MSNTNFIVFDLEMNQGYKPFNFSYGGFEQVLRGEIIQIGAAKIDENANVLDTFNINLKPQIFKKLHHHVAKVTGLSQEDLNCGEPIKQGLEKFLQWCGEDAVLFEWGLDDVPILKQNLVLSNLDENFPQKWYDLQQMVAEEFPPNEGEKMNLEAVVARLEIPLVRQFHDALCDVLYTCDVAKKLNLSQSLANYPSDEQKLYQNLTSKGEIFGFSVSYGHLDQFAWRNSKELYSAVCPFCGGVLQPNELAFKFSSNCYYTLCCCEKCQKQAFLLFKLMKSDGLHWSVAKAVRETDDKNLAKWRKSVAAKQAEK